MTFDTYGGTKPSRALIVMMRAIAALGLAASVLACATAPATLPSAPPGVPTGTPVAPSNSPAPSASPDVPLPSNACGGFHLKVVNEDAQDVIVTINDSYTVTIAAGDSQTIVQFLPQPKPPMPWLAVVTTSTGAEIGTETFTGPVDQKLTVSPNGMSVEPYDIREDDC